MYKINDQEREALYGLPHLQQLLYLIGLRPYMDFGNGCQSAFKIDPRSASKIAPPSTLIICLLFDHSAPC